MADRKYSVGIDLGTSNCAVAFAPLAGSSSSSAITDFPVTQLLREGQVSPETLLPSALYAPTEGERNSGGLELPWGSSSEWVMGQFARWRGAKVPGRLITSAKSWLCHPGVDRTAGILPWGGAADISKISPVAASAAESRRSFFCRPKRERASRRAATVWLPFARAVAALM